MVQSDHSPADWFAAQVWSGRERMCAGYLSSRGYEIFLPTYRESRRWSDRVKKVERPLFPGYLFCRIPGDIVGKVVTAPGVIRIVHDGLRPLPVDREEIESIRRVIDMRLTVEPSQCLCPGQRVRFDAGPLHDMEGIVVQARNRHRLIISVSLLQRSVAVEIDPAWVTVISSQPS